MLLPNSRGPNCEGNSSRSFPKITVDGRSQDRIADLRHVDAVWSRQAHMPILADGVTGRTIGREQVSSPVRKTVVDLQWPLWFPSGNPYPCTPSFTLIKTRRVHTGLILFVCPIVNGLQVEKAGILLPPAFNQFLGSDATDTYLVMRVCHFNMISARMTRVVPAKRERTPINRRPDPPRAIFQYPTHRQSSIRAFIRHTGDNGAGRPQCLLLLLHHLPQALHKPS